MMASPVRRHTLTVTLLLVAAASLLTSGGSPAAARGRPKKQRPEATRPRASGKVSLQKVRDEFNTTEDPGRLDGRQVAVGVSGPPLAVLASRSPALRRILLRLELDECCPPWAELTQMAAVQDEQKKMFGKARAQMRAEDLLEELSQVFTNITQYSIDGQEGQSEWQKYYKFYDNVQYYLRLVRVSEDYLGTGGADSGRDASGGVGDGNQSGGKQVNVTGRAHQASPMKRLKAKGLLPADEDLALVDRDFKRQFRRQLKSIQFKISQDPVASSFINELLHNQDPFEHYENFIRFTQFGQYYARNISMVRDSIQVLELIGSHLESLSFPSNLTRPSKVYQMIRSMSRELFRTKHELLESVSGRVLVQRQDVGRAFREMDSLVASRPDIRMLGDEFGFNRSPPGLEFSANVRQLTHLLDLYTTNNMTHLSFYNQLSTLPEEFIFLGLAVAHEYETRELPQYSRFNSDYYNWEYSGRLAGQHERVEAKGENSSTSSSVDSARSNQGERPFFSRIFFGR